MPAGSVELPAKTLFVGGRGRMARLFLRLAQARNLDTSSVDRPFAPDSLRAAADGASLVFLCVPANVLKEVLATVCPYLPETCVVSDITSVKEQPMQLMEEAWPGAVVGTHPLFGPSPDFSLPLPVAITAGHKSSERALAMVKAFWSTLGCRVFSCSAEEHDQAMAKIQNLNFITNLAYFALLAGQEELLPFLTPSFQRRLVSAKKMLTEDAAMFSVLFERNPHSHDIVRKYRKMLNIAASGDIEILCQRAWWWWQNKV